MDTFKRRYIIKSAADLKKIQGYRYDIDPEYEPLKRILQHYFVTPTIQCGLSGCHKWHNEGFLVELENGDLTNVGHVCGAGFGDKFESERIFYSESVLRPHALKIIREGKIRLNSLKEQLNAMSDVASRLSFRKSEFKKRFPDISKGLDRRASNGSSVITESISRTNEEIEDLLAANPRQSRESLRFREVEKGRIAGLQLFSFNIREKIIQDIVTNALTLIVLDIETCTVKTETLLQWEGWLKAFDERLAEASDFIAKAEKFFNEDNYQLIASLPASPNESFLLKQLKTISLDENVTGNALQVAIQDKKPNRAERRKLQFNASNMR